MSVAERDRFVLPDSIRRSPLMEGLRILPDEALMGPKDVPAPAAPGKEKTPPTPNGEAYEGPRPRLYGPVIPRPKPTSTVQRAVYGPKIVQSDPLVRE